MCKYKEYIKKLNDNNLNITIREIKLKDSMVNIFYINNIADRMRISEEIIKPIILNKDKYNMSLDEIFSSIIFIDDIKKSNDDKKFLNEILSGNTIITLSNESEYIVANTIKIEKRSVSSPQLKNTLVSPKDSFTENYDTNLSLIRYRLKDKNLSFDTLNIGTRTKTAVCIIHIKNIANKKTVSLIKNKLKKINIDGVIKSGELQKYLLKNKYDLFPQSIALENSSEVCEELLKGKVCILVDGSNLVISAPNILLDFFNSADDNAQNMYINTFSKILRLSALFISLCLTSLYVAIIAFHPDFVPARFIIALAASKQTVPVNTAIEAFVMDALSEILREASVRLPKQIGQAIGIVGTIVIGNAAVSAGLVSPVMVMVISLSMLCSFVSPDYTIMNSFRVLKFMLLLLTSILGLFGFSIGITIVSIILCSTISIDVPYVSILSPFSFKGLIQFMSKSKNLYNERSFYLDNRDNSKG